MPLWMIIAYAVISAIIIFAIVKMIKRKITQFVKISFSSIIGYSLLFFVVWIFKLPIPSYIILLTMLTSLLTCYFGYYRMLYQHSRVFDRFVHAFSTFSMSLLAYSIIKVFITVGGSRLFQALFVFAAGMTVGSIFELKEAYHDAKKRKEIKEQKGLRDTNMDILFDLIGSCLSALFAYYALI